MRDWELRLSKLLETFHVEGIRGKIVVFAALATLIPSVSTAVLSYLQNRRALTQRISEALRNSSSQAAREVDLWTKERLYDVRVFASSYEVSENVDRVRRNDRAAQASRRLRDYLSSVKDRFPDYEELLVVDRGGRPVESTAAGTPSLVDLPGDWVEEARAREAIMGNARWDSAAGKPVIAFAVPITATDGRFLGALAAKLSLVPVAGLLGRFTPGDSGTLYLVAREGGLVTSSAGGDRQLMDVTLSAARRERLGASEREPIAYNDHRAVPVLGSLSVIPRLDWAILAEIPQQEAYAQIRRLRNLTFTTVFALLLGMGAVAYLLGLTIVRPLDRLAKGARQVASGDLSITLPALGGGEVAYVTEVFNDMVTRLRQGREELERLSRTDSLTGLPNRRHLMEILDKEIRRAQRNEKTFSLLMIDVDHFKRFNDTLGHLAGDALLKDLGQALLAAVRTADYAARYGGEEFLVLLPETSVEGATEVAERIRAKVAEPRPEHGDSPVTISIGVAEYPQDGETLEGVIASADSALYEAKQQGRDRIVTTRTKAHGKRSKKTS